MEKIFKNLFFPMLILATAFVANASAETGNIREKLSGRILLQVESHGEAWYVDPVSKTRVSLGRPADAFNVMRQFGLGITNSDLAQIASSSEAAKDNAISKRLSGRILLQVEEQGQAWYVSPVNLKRYSLGNPQQAFQVMRNLGLGITNSDLEQIPVFSETGLRSRLAGRILLQVEEQGQAWYVDPVSKERVFLGRPTDAFNIMREFGLGITNSDLAKIASSTEATKDNATARRLSGRILLQVEGQGQAWYVNPVNLKRYALGTPQQAFTIMKDLGLGITNKNLSQIPLMIR